MAGTKIIIQTRIQAYIQLDQLSVS